LLKGKLTCGNFIYFMRLPVISIYRRGGKPHVCVLGGVGEYMKTFSEESKTGAPGGISRENQRILPKILTAE
jgi:hypothetical protein